MLLSAHISSVIRLGVTTRRRARGGQVVVGMGTLAGSTVMMLSIAWGGSLIVGRCDIDPRGIAKDKTLTRFRTCSLFLIQIYTCILIHFT